MSMQQYCLRWNNHQPNFISVFSNLLSSESLVDVTLSADGRHLQAHKLVLSACSSYFQSLFTINPCQHPIVILKDVKFADLKVIIDFMYFGEVNVSQDQLPHILKTAEMLKIKGLAEIPVEASVKQQNSTERAELLTHGGDSNWNSTESNRQSPSPCPLSPGSKRKRLRKSSTGSGTGSTEKSTDEQHASNEVTLTSPLAMAVIKSDPGNYNTENNNANANKQGHNVKHETSGSHESAESRSPHQITLQIPHEIPVQHSSENTSSIEMPGPSSTTSQTVTGYQWGIVDQHYSHFTQATLTLPQDLQQYNSTPPITQYYPGNVSTPATSHPVESHSRASPHQQQVSSNHPPATPSTGGMHHQKRKRSVNPQADENFVRALDAVRYGGIGFCKAARMYGVNNRTLWLEYKKRGYPISRLSIKNRNSESATSAKKSDPESPPPSSDAHEDNSSQHSQPPPPQQQSRPPQPQSIPPPPSSVQQHPGNGVTMISGAFIDGRPVEIATPVLQRSRYFDNGGLLHTTPINLQNMNFDQM